MSLDLHRLESGRAKERLLSLDEGMYWHLEPAFSLYKKRTGLLIDPYGDLKLSSGFRPLIEALNETLCTTKQPDARSAMSALLLVLSEADKNQIDLIFCGD